MNVEKYVVLSGLPGVYYLVAARNNGVIVEDLKEKRTRFVATRQHQVTPLATVAVYTETEEGSVPLSEVFQRMLDAFPQTPPPPVDEASTVLREYFAQVLPEHDRDRVHIADIKKCIRWFRFMREHGIFERMKQEAAQETASASASEEPSEANPT